MSLKNFNIAILIGWLLVLIGGCLLDVALGLAFAGLLLLGLTLTLARLAGLYRPAPKKEEDR